MAFDFTGKTVWVTGAGKGIGYATALAFVEAGAQVTGFDLAFPHGEYPFATETLDVADAAQASDVCGRLLSSLERLDVLVNAAGILRMGATDQLAGGLAADLCGQRRRRVQPVPADDGPVPSSAGGRL